MLQEELYTQKVELLLEMQNKKLMTELQGVREQLADMQEQMNALRKAQLRAPSPAVAAPAVQAATTHAPVQAAQPAAPAQPTATAEPIDRNNVAPADVSIEKIFYFGQK